MLPTVQPRVLVWSGRQPVHGLVIDAALVGVAEARARALAAWRIGTTITELDGGALWVAWPEPVLLPVEALPGAPLVAREGAWLEGPLDDREWAALAPVPQGALVRVRGGVATVVVPARRVVDPAQWIALEGLALAPARSLGVPPRPIEAPSVAAPLELRRKLLPAGAQARPAEAEAVLAELRGEREGRGARAAGVVGAAGAARGAAGAGASAGSVLGALRAGWRWVREVAAEVRRGMAADPASGGRAAAERAAADRSGAPGAPSGRALSPHRARPWWSRVWAALRQPLGARAPSPARGAGSGARTGAPAPDPVGVAARLPPSPLARGLRRLARYLQLSRWTGRQTARYLTDMLDKFERGDLTEALKHAIPLGGGAPGGESEPASGAPQPRRALEISTRPAGAAGGGALYASGDLYAHLRRLYRSAFERLEREGKIEEAAFVLAELLGQSAEAVSFLERHGKLRLAAELAEGRKLDPALVVRQWFLAGEIDRAVAVAREHQAFAAAIERLRRSHPQQARQLSLLWADLSADAGNFVLAVDIAESLPDAPAGAGLDGSCHRPGRRAGRSHAGPQGRARPRRP